MNAFLNFEIISLKQHHKENCNRVFFLTNHLIVKEKNVKGQGGKYNLYEYLLSESKSMY